MRHQPPAQADQSLRWIARGRRALPVIVGLIMSTAALHAQEAPSTAPRIPPLESSDGINISKTLGHHPELADAWGTFAGYILRDSTLPPRDRELLILRIGYLCGAEYEWGQHSRIARRVGLSDEEIVRVTTGPEAAGWSSFTPPCCARWTSCIATPTSAIGPGLSSTLGTTRSS